LSTGKIKLASSVCIVVPTYNEAENVPRLVKSLDEELGEEKFTLILIDDSSPDGTADIAEDLEIRNGNIIVNRRPGKLGIGSAIRDGIKIALSFPSCKRIVTMDADLSHDPKDIQRLLEDSKEVDLVQGSRYIKGGRIVGWSLKRKITSNIANLLCRILLRTHLHEHTTYFRVYSREAAKIAVENVHCDRYEWAIGSILAVKDHGLRVTESPITFVERTRGKSKLKTSDILGWFSYLMKTFVSRSLNRVKGGMNAR